MPDVTIKIDGADAVREYLRGLAGKIANMRPAMKAIGDLVVRQTKDRFESQGPAPDGTPLADLKASTLRRKKHSKKLTETTALRGSIHAQVTDSNTVRIGTGEGIPYARIHQLGGTITQGARSEIFTRNRYKRATTTGKQKGHFKKGTAEGRGLTFRERKITITARPFLGLSAGNSTEIIGIINEYITAR